MSLVLVEADKAIVLVILVDHISGLVGWYAVMSFSLKTENLGNYLQHFNTFSS